MAKKVLTKAAIAKLKRKGATIEVVHKSKPIPKIIDTSQSSTEMLIAVRVAEAAVSAANAAKDLAINMANDNKVFLTNMVEVIKGNQVIQFKINRDENKMLDTVDLIRESK